MSTKPRFASLHGGLVARRGEAAPSPGVVHLPYGEQPPAAAAPRAAPPDDEPIVRRDAAASHPIPPSAAEERPRRTPRHTCGDARAGSATRRMLSVRLDASTHLKIRLAAAHMGTTVTSVVLEAIARHLKELDREEFHGCGCLHRH